MDNLDSNVHLPKVSIIVPCYNEEATISMLLEALYEQDFPRYEMEVVIADGMSTDNTRQKVNEFKKINTDLTINIIDNRKRIIPAGLNRAIDHASGEYIIRLDAHAIPATDYVSRCVFALENNYGTNVGGVWDIQPGGNSWIAGSIARAGSHIFGAGDAQYRLGGRAQSVDTVPFGAFRRSLVEEIGAYDEGLETNEDYEFNTRIRQTGGIIWFDPAIKCRYFARPNLCELARQYWRYGYWKTQMLRKYPSTLRWRQLLPPIFVFGLILLTILAFFNSYALLILLLEVALYVLCLILAGIHTAFKDRSPHHLIGIPLALATMHTFWGSSFIWGMLTLN